MPIYYFRIPNVQFSDASDHSTEFAGKLVFRLQAWRAFPCAIWKKTVNELCTNTTKFGALSTPVGRVEIAWAIDDANRRLGLTWTERGGPPVQAPAKRSFGTRMMQSLGQQLNGQVQLAYDPAGFVYSLDIPLSSIAAAL